MSRHILIDENIPLAAAAFSHLGHLERFSGRALSPAQIQRADALIVRSITRVDQSLLQGSKVSFVGTCTIGTDHLALNELHPMGVTTASAPGCNANSVVEYVLAALMALGEDWLHKKCLIIGCGNVGHRLAQRLQALGAEVCGYDPFLTPKDRDYLCDFSAIKNADIVCVHTPYTQDGEYPTHHLLDAEALSHLKKGAILINAGRGGAIDNEALLQLLQSQQTSPDSINAQQNLRVALDVWENEPTILQPLMHHVDVATPHIAGYSWDGKAKGTWQIARALERHWQEEQAVESTPLSDDGWQSSAPVPECQTLLLAEVFSAFPRDTPYIQLWQAILNKVYDIRADDRRLREALSETPDASPKLGELTPFDRLRKQYPVRREWMAFSLDFSGWGDRQIEYRQRLWKDATIMGFHCLSHTE